MEDFIVNFELSECDLFGEILPHDFLIMEIDTDPQGLYSMEPEFDTKYRNA
jgi:hypothetical protein